MPLVQVSMWKGISEEKVKQIIKGITDVFVNMGIPSRAVHVIVYETPKSNWGIDGKPATEALPDEQP